MDNLHDLAVLLVFGAVVASWMQLARAREIAVAAARRHCQLHGLQLLDETVGLKSIRLRTINGSRRIERIYAFEVSIDGNDRESGHISMHGRRVTGLALPTVRWMTGESLQDAGGATLASPGSRSTDDGEGQRSNNVIPLRRRMPPGD
ncbi:MAG: DUF3301 domain-containing protein [Xanthomonadaceae bacterium]|nr:DUF3301 domain-containing protein [Xanthomonadaceae bacterium]MDE1963119.1 DUF3301 domain-containing protein [Xanthomonadaceae bacterium]